MDERKQNEDCLMMAPTSAADAGISWWERVVVQRSACAIENLVEAAVESSTYLNKSGGSIDSLAKLTRENVQIGKLLGRGTYSNVYEIQGFDIPEDDSLRCVDGEEKGHCISEQYGRLERLRQSTNDPTSSKRLTYAIKHLKPELLKNSKCFETAAMELIIEAKLLSSLSHPNILTIHGIALGESSAFRSGLFDSYFIIMDKVHETLNRTMQRWRVDSASGDTATKINIALQVGRALEYLHDPSRRLIYRDLKPHNIGLLGDGTVKLLDFGFCREMPHTRSNQIRLSPSVSAEARDDESVCVDGDDVLHFMSGKGTLMYMAPEILSTRMFNQKADTYSWSMVFYEMLTLSRPFPLRSIDEHRKALVKRKERPPLYNTNIPYPLQYLLQNCWDGDVYQRFRMSEACDHLENLLWECQEGSNALDDARASIFCTLQDLFGAFLIDFRTGYANTNLAGFDQKNIKKRSCEKEEKDTGTCGTETSRSVGSNKGKENVLNGDKTTRRNEKESNADDADSINPKCLMHDKAHDVKPTINPLTVKSPAASTRTPSAGLLAPNGKLIYHKFYGPFGRHGRIDYTTMEWLTA